MKTSIPRRIQLLRRKANSRDSGDSIPAGRTRGGVYGSTRIRTSSTSLAIPMSGSSGMRRIRGMEPSRRSSASSSLPRRSGSLQLMRRTSETPRNTMYHTK
jgi:hypothetical protein